MRNSVKFTTLAVDINIIEMVKDKIEAILKEKGMTKGELAEKIGVSPQSLSRSLNSCSERTLYRMAKALDVDWHDLKEEKANDCANDTITSSPLVTMPIPPVEANLNGYVECRGKVFRIATKEDLYKVIAYHDGYNLNKENNESE